MNFKQFINPHSHSDGSLDGAATVHDIVKRNIELGATYVAMTEHGNINTAMDLYTTCHKLGAKPILGCELYLEPPFMDYLKEKWENHFKDDPKKDMKVAKKLKGEYVHLTIHFKDVWAYNYFCRISPDMDERAVVIFGERKAICTMEELRGAAGHITIGSGCLVGAVQKWILPDKQTGQQRLDLAEKAYMMLRELAPGDFFVEIFPHRVTHNWKAPKKDKTGRIIEQGEFVKIPPTECCPDGDLQLPANKFVYEMAKKHGDPCLISLDSHFATPDQKIIQDSKLGNGREAWKFHTSYHLESTDNLVDNLKETLGVTDEEIHEWVENSWKWASKFDDFKLETNEDRWILPKLDSEWHLQLQEKIVRHGRMNWNDEAMVERLKYEIGILANNGKINFMSYFFLIEDIANFCRENNILMNVRGSAGGSLVIYLLGISAVNPLKHGLSFERFLTMGRIMANTPPDVDMDVGNKDRVLKYIDDLYGDKAVQLSIDMMLRLKSSIKDAERALTGVVSKTTEIMTKKLPQPDQGANEKEVVFGYSDASDVWHPGLIETNTHLKTWAALNPEIWKAAAAMIGIQRQKSIHACGLVIADKPIKEYCPIIKVSGGTTATGFSPKSVEMAGLIKYDLLGVNTLEDIEVTLNTIRDRHGISINPWDLPHCEKTYEGFHNGDTATVFQFSTDTVIPYLKSIKPNSLDDLSGITALCRPGTLDAIGDGGRTLAKIYVARSQGEAIQYIHPDLEPILKDTKGIQLYQEQTIEIFKRLAYYSDEQAETVRRGIGKKIESVLASCMSDLKEACLGRGWTEKQVELLVDQIMASSRYSFNKSHSMSYAYVAYACQYLKTNYPLEWWMSCLSHATKNELASDFWRYVKDFTKLPDINLSQEQFVIEGESIRAPISIISGVGEKAYAQIMEHAPYKDFETFIEVHLSKRKVADGRSAVNAGIVRKLIVAGVMDSMFDSSLEVEEKLLKLEELKSVVRKEKLESIPSEYIGITHLGNYMIKKSLIKVYSEDLRPVMLPPRGGAPSKSSWGGAEWSVEGFRIVDAEKLGYFKKDAEMGIAVPTEVGCIAYVVDERSFKYQTTKQATDLTVDVGGAFYKEVLWPKWGTDEPAKSGFKGLPVLMVYNVKESRCSLIKVVPLLSKDQLAVYNMT